MDHPPSFGRILRERRKSCDLTQEQLAEKVSYSVETIKKIEAGKLRPGKQLVERLADCLELEVQERATFLHAARAVTEPLRPALPQGTVTFLFTDIEGSTRLWERYPQAMQSALARHDAMLRQVIEEYGGVVFKTVGDAFHAVFARAQDALAAALAAQRALYAEDWGQVDSLRVRMALHTGVAEERDGDYFGAPLNRVARLLDVSHGGQVVLSQGTHVLVRDYLPPSVAMRDLGSHRLKDLTRTEPIFQLVAPDLPGDFPPLRNLEIRHISLSAAPTQTSGPEEAMNGMSALPIYTTNQKEAQSKTEGYAQSYNTNLNKYIIAFLYSMLAALVISLCFFVVHLILFSLIDWSVSDVETPFIKSFISGAKILSLIAFNFFIFIHLIIHFHQQWVNLVGNEKV